jgi:protocatechuate 3,4-dioxygenase beta subunit
VQVVGFGGTVTSADGSFFVGNVPPGVYEVELDPERLPLELVPVQRRFVVEVAAGTITRVDFPLRQLYGFAGQVRTTDGVGVAGARVVLLSRGTEVASQETDAFGYFRFDQLEPGTYLLQAWRGEQKLGERPVLLEGFLFDQDIVANP